jgi:hypothetical protein
MRRISTDSIITIYTLGGFAGITLETAKAVNMGKSITLGELPKDLIHTTVNLLDDIRKESLLRRVTGRSRLTYSITNCGSAFCAIELDGMMIYTGQTFAPVPDQVIELTNIVEQERRRTGASEAKTSQTHFR